MSENNGKTPAMEEVQETDTANQEQSDSTQFTPEYVKELRNEAAANRVKAKELSDKLAEIEAKNAEAERKRLEKQGEFQALYQQANETAMTTSAELEKARAEIEVLATALKTSYEAQSKDAPDYIKELLEGMPVVKRLEWIAKNSDKINTQKQNGTPSRNVQRQRQEIKPPEQTRSRFRF